MSSRPVTDREDKLIDALWDEWSACPVASGPAAEAECAGLLAGLFPAASDGAEGDLALGIRRPRAARRLLRLWRVTSWSGGWNIAEALDLERGERRSGVTLVLPAALRESVEAVSQSWARTPSGRLSANRWAWLRGLWGSCGSLYLPRTGQALSFRIASPSVELPLRRLLNATRLPWVSRFFRGAREMSLREQEGIVTFLCNIGLPDASLKLEERAILRSARERANRERNCDTANVHRAVRVAEKQTKLAARLAAQGLLPFLDPVLRQLAEVRLRNPAASLSELGAQLVPPVTKSTVKYRWARLEKIAGGESSPKARG